MAKRAKISVLCFSIIAAIAMIFAIPTFSWWVNNLSTNISITANLLGSYFEQGDGTEDTPYVIARPIQLYYFAWLQNMGYFDGENSLSETEDKKFYFTLGASIDMSENTEYSSLPPIGTADHPFRGVFDGRYHFAPTDEHGNSVADPLDPDNTLEGTYHVISNVTINNSNLSNVPPQGEDGMQYIGLFGVVGSITDSSVTGEIKNFGLSNVTLATSDPIDDKTIIGIVAGYCNGSASGIGVSGCSISVANGLSPASVNGSTPDTLSFALIGYSSKTYEAYGISSISGGSNFGGSLAMKDMYEDILAARNSGINGSTYYAKKTIIIDAAGNENVIYSNETTKRIKQNDRYYEYGNNQVVDNDGNVVASYGVLTRYDGATTIFPRDEWMYLAGGLSTDVTRNVVTIRQTNETAYTIGDGNGNYLVGDASSVSNTQEEDLATTWTFSNPSGPSTTIKVRINNTDYYLRNNSGKLVMSTTSTTWTISNSNGKQIISNGSLYLVYANNSWSLCSTETQCFSVDNGAEGDSKKFMIDTTYAMPQVGTQSKTNWHYVSNKIYCYRNGTKYYLYLNNSNALRLSQNADDTYVKNTTWTISNGVIQGKRGSNTRYVYYTGSAWGVRTTSATLNIIYYDYVKTNTTETVNRTVSLSTETITLQNVDTFIPLASNDDGTVSSRNTGYIVSGANYNSPDYLGDIRVSYYSISGNLTKAINGDSYSSDGSNMEILTRTYKSNGFKRISDSYNASNPENSVNSTLRSYEKQNLNNLGLLKYVDPREQLHNTLSSSSNVYGLHFMDAAISESNTIEVDKATINGKHYTNYILPQDCIDFNLSSRGYVNFFAGTYFPGNTAFFSLHQITRNGAGDIVSISEIEKIYGDPSNSANSYLYKYVGGSTPSLPEGYVLMFDTTWLTAPTMVENAMYYFEIPLNSGEYALGSVEGGNGAYLIYLDIGASAQSLDDGTTLETSIVGMDFVGATALNSSNIATTLSGIASDSIAAAVIVIKDGFQGTITFVKTEENGISTITCTLSDPISETFVKWTAVSTDTEVVIQSSA